MRLLLLLSSALGFTLRAPGRSATARAASAAPPESGAEARLLALVARSEATRGAAMDGAARAEVARLVDELAGAGAAVDGAALDGEWKLLFTSKVLSRARSSSPLLS